MSGYTYKSWTRQPQQPDGCLRK